MEQKFFWCIISKLRLFRVQGMMLKLKLQYFGHLIRRVDSMEKTLMLGGIGGRRRRGRQRMRWLDGITDLMHVESGWTPEVGDGQGGLTCCDSWGRKESDTTERLNWTELTVELQGRRLCICSVLVHTAEVFQSTYTSFTPAVHKRSIC